ncbi:MAG: zf-HC2 domain-containing protein [Actinomycetota bacterium]
MTSCEQWRDALSARADGEDPGVPEHLLDEHLGACSECASFARFVPELRRSAVAAAPRVPDVSSRVAREIRIGEDPRRTMFARVLLGVCAVEIMVFATFDLVSSAHDARHLGAFSASIGVAMALVALRPTRAAMLMPVAAVLGAALVVGAVVDVSSGRIPLVTEVAHLPEIMGIAALWMLVKQSRSARRQRRLEKGRWSRPLRVVAVEDEMKGTA